MLSRRAVLCAVIVLLCPLRAFAADAAHRPNFVFIISDDQRWDMLGVAGHPGLHTPYLDKLAKQGCNFRQGTIHVSQCSPSRCTLLTGLPPHQHRWYSNQYQHPDVINADGFKGLPTMTGLLRQAGYRTVLVGKWHPRPEPWNCGFSDVRLWLPGGGGPYTAPSLARGKSRDLTKTPGLTQELFTDDALTFLQSKEAGEAPFLLWLAYTAPHGPYAPVPERISQRYADKTLKELQPPGFPATTGKAPWREYCGAISHLDEQVGRVLQTLEERKLAERTVVVFLGDNGYMMQERGLHGKVVPYESSVRVPFIVRAPGGKPVVSDVPASSLDLPPTLLHLAGITPPKDWTGRDLTPVLQGKTDHGIREAYCEFADDQSKEFGDVAFRLVRTPTHKLIVWARANKPDEFYDLAADPREQKNLATDPATAPIRDDLRQRLKTWMERTADPAQKWKK
ncbi:MAG: sulfatase-like hydrolase/transferase [Planctomycetia bacterium]|nr:sulfatase-like hydrolase/transferase [Planctomycetia bacterium]